MAQPTLHRPTIIAAFTGWNDAGDAASNSVRHLIEAWNAQPLAEIDPGGVHRLRHGSTRTFD